MSRRYAEQIEVRLGEPMVALRGAPDVPGLEQELAPTAFLWRGRLHVVRAVLGCWTQRLPWWRLADWQEEEHPGAARGGGAVTAATSPVGTAVVAELEQQVWRVEASAGRALGTGVYELARSGDRWELQRVSD